jgi:hypothetical protein
MSESLIILSASIGATKPLEKFLQARKWDVISESDLEAVISTLSLIHPDYVLVSSDFPAAKALQVIQKLSETIGFVVIQFQEKPSAATGMKVKSCNGYNLGTALTGSNFLRTIAKIEADKASGKISVRGHLPKSDHASNFTGSTQSATTGLAGKVTVITPIHEDLAILENAIQRALKSVFGAGDNEIPNSHVTIGRNSLCLAVSSTNVSGYVVAAIDDNQEIDRAKSVSLMHFLNESVGAFLDRGFKIEIVEASLSDAHFFDISNSHAAFHRTAKFGDSEIGLAFFIKEDGNISCGFSSEPTMRTISVQCLAPDSLIDFELYYYLPRNQRYVKFNHKGYVLERDRLTRCKSRVSTMHVKEVDYRKADAYCAEMFFNSKVTSGQRRAA